MPISEIILLLNIIILAISVWLSFRRVRPQNLTDESNAAVNFQNSLVKLQLEKELQDEKIQKLIDTIECAHLEVTMVIEIGKPPIISHHSWAKKNQEVIVSPI